MAGGIEELISSLYEMVQDAWSLPLGADKCVLERDKVLDILDEINNQFPSEVKQAKTIVEARNEVITQAKREAESIRRQAEEKARQMISKEEIVLGAKKRASEIISEAEAKSKELRRLASDYVDDSLKRTEEAVENALNDVKQTRNKFKAIARSTAAQKQAESPIIEDLELG